MSDYKTITDRNVQAQLELIDKQAKLLEAMLKPTVTVTEKTLRDALTFGTGYMLYGKHVPMEAVMTDDLVKRLRSGEETCGIYRCAFRDIRNGCFCAIVADRIEAQDKRNKELEAALREIEMLHYDSETDFHHDAMKAHDIARAALGEKKNG